ncbi:ABC transporter ATP-binding protein [Nocardioides sp. C4-1]|uniref:ABC transporter ATP-binding protein n=1 Tax=Nocardioides sp. C4-1 TaxID=3151851 RepID=UPI0032644A84
MSDLVLDDVGPAGDREPVLAAEDLRVWYGTDRGPVRAVDGVSFELQPGEILGLVGESGCGKSTLGRGLLGLLPPGAARDGALRFRGKDMLSLKKREQYRMRGSQLGMIFQEPLTRLNPMMRISDHFAETLRTHEPGIDKHDVEDRSLEALRVMGIPPTRFRAFPHEFSGGMRQRLMIALALVLRPAFVVADEPTTALDVLVEAQIIRILHDLRETYDTSLLLITHNLGIVAEACDRVAVMYAGKIVEIGPSRQVFARPEHSYTRELLRSTISLSTTGLNYIEGAPPDLTDPPSGCHFHPRCPDAMAICTTTEPTPRTVEGGATVACWASEVRHGTRLDDADRAPLDKEEIALADEA